MEKTYNARLSFKGEGSFTFALPKKGETTIYAGRDIYVKGLTAEAVEYLRTLRVVSLEHTLNAKPDGCYMVIDLNELSPIKPFRRIVDTDRKVSVADLKASLTKAPITDEELNAKSSNSEMDAIVDDTLKEISEENLEAESFDEPETSTGDMPTNEPKTEAPEEPKKAENKTSKGRAKSNKSKNKNKK